MSKEELIEFEGLVTEILPDARYRIQLDTGHVIVAYTAGKMKKNRIKTLAGDRVTVEMSPYDLDKGRLIFRHKDERAGVGRRPPVRQQFRSEEHTSELQSHLNIVCRLLLEKKKGKTTEEFKQRKKQTVLNIEKTCHAILGWGRVTGRHN